MTLFILLSALILDPAHSCWWRHQGSLQSVSRASSSCASLDSRVAGLTKQLDNLHLPVTPSDSHGRSFNMGERSCVFCLVYLWYSRNNAQPACLTLQTFFSCVIVCSNFESTAQKNVVALCFGVCAGSRVGLSRGKGLERLSVAGLCLCVRSPTLFYSYRSFGFLSPMFTITDWMHAFCRSVIDQQCDSITQCLIVFLEALF